MYDLLDANWEEQDALQLFCDTGFGRKICEDFIGAFADADPEVDNFDRFDILLKDYPAGQGYQTIVAFAQTG